MLSVMRTMPSFSARFSRRETVDWWMLRRSVISVWRRPCAVVEARDLRHQPQLVEARHYGALLPAASRCARDDRIAPAGDSGRARRRPCAVRSGRSCAAAARARPCDGQTPTARPASQAAPQRREVGGVVAHDRHAEDVGLKLHQRVVPAGAAVGEQRRARRRRRASRRRRRAPGRRWTRRVRAPRARRVVPRVSPQTSPRASHPSTARRARRRPAPDRRRRCRRPSASPRPPRRIGERRETGRASRRRRR